jgi:hypothetical protein
MDFRHSGMFHQVPGDLFRCTTDASHAYRKGFDSPDDTPGIEWKETQPGGVLDELEPLAEFFVTRDECTGDYVRMPAQVLGRRRPVWL